MSDKDKAKEPEDQATPALPESGADAGAPASAIEAQQTQADRGRKTTAGKAANAAKVASKPPKNKRGGWRFLLWLLLVLVIGGLLVAGIVAAKRQLEIRDQQGEQRMGELRNELAATQEQLAKLGSNYEQLRRAQAEQLSQNQQLQNRLDEMQQSLAYQRDRLRALSTTTREDWLLAEAEYLLKLANQRLLVERSTEAAAGLLEEADKILRDLSDPQLAPLRRAIARDLTQLKLAARVDLEGLYMRLAALAESVHQLPSVARRQPAAPEQREPQEQEPTVNDAGTWWQGALNVVKDMFDDLGNYIRIRDHAEKPSPILPPDSAQYLQQNLRLMLERAQLAAMREQADLYRRSLENVIDWARRYYPESQQLNNFVGQVRELAEIDVQLELPDISQSLSLVTDYIDRLHKLEEVEAPESDENAEAQP